jgi:hypothetical protein
MFLASALFVSNEVESFYNGLSDGATTILQTPTDITEDPAIGVGADSNYAARFKCGEFIFYKSDQSSNRTDIETNINSYFNIYS